MLHAGLGSAPSLATILFVSHSLELVGDVLDTRELLLATADNASDSDKVRPQIKDEGNLGSSAPLQSDQRAAVSQKSYPGSALIAAHAIIDLLSIVR